MKLKITSALRLIRKDLDRLTDLHRQQFFMAINPISAAAGEDPEMAYENIETGKRYEHETEGPEEFGLIYLHVENSDEPKEAYEGWFIDWGRYPDTESKPDTGAFFRAGTKELTEVYMSQHGYYVGQTSAKAKELLAAVEELGTTFQVVVKGPALKANPPFAFATKPKKESPPPSAPIDLEVVEARRVNEAEARKLPPQERLQLLHGLRWKFIQGYNTIETMEGGMGLPFIYSSFDLGADPRPRIPADDQRLGIVYLKLKTQQKPERVFEGWFWDKKKYPTKETRIFLGCLMLAGTVKPTGVTLENGKVKFNPKKGLPDGFPIAEAFKKLGVNFEV